MSPQRRSHRSASDQDMDDLFEDSTVDANGEDVIADEEEGEEPILSNEQDLNTAPNNDVLIARLLHNTAAEAIQRTLSLRKNIDPEDSEYVNITPTVIAQTTARQLERYKEGSGNMRERQASRQSGFSSDAGFGSSYRPKRPREDDEDERKGKKPKFDSGGFGKPPQAYGFGGKKPRLSSGVFRKPPQRKPPQGGFARKPPGIMAQAGKAGTKPHFGPSLGGKPTFGRKPTFGTGGPSSQALTGGKPIGKVKPLLPVAPYKQKPAQLPLIDGRKRAAPAPKLAPSFYSSTAHNLPEDDPHACYYDRAPSHAHARGQLVCCVNVSTCHNRAHSGLKCAGVHAGTINKPRAWLCGDCHDNERPPELGGP